jgi:hypothetical protein
MDTHMYQIFSNGVRRSLLYLPWPLIAYAVFKEVAMSQNQHIQAACGKGSELSSFNLWILVQSYWQSIFLQLKLQDVFEEDLGIPGNSFREGVGLDLLDLES